MPSSWIPTYLHCELSLRKVCSLLLVLGSLQAALVGGQSPPDGTGLLWAEIERNVFLSLVEETELVALLKVDDGQDTGNRFADIVTA